MYLIPQAARLRAAHSLTRSLQPVLFMGSVQTYTHATHASIGNRPPDTSSFPPSKHGSSDFSARIANIERMVQTLVQQKSKKPGGLVEA